MTPLACTQRGCLGPLCAIPQSLPADRNTGVASKLVADALVGHAWLESAPAELLGWFEAH